MPPKRRTDASDPEGKKAKVDPDPSVPLPSAPPPVITVPDSTTTTPTLTTTASPAPPASIPAKPSTDDILDSDSEDDDPGTKPKCRYGINCFRKNPAHLKEFWHPTKKSTGSSSSSSSSSSSTTTTTTTTSSSSSTPTLKRADSKLLPPGNSEADMTEKLAQALETYKGLLKIILGKNKISVDDKRTLRLFRKEHDISDHHHFRALSQFGWTEDEYDDGEKKEDNIDLEEERLVLANPDGFKIIWLNRCDVKKMTKEQENVFSRVCTRFFQTMARAQSNYLVKRVGIVASTKIRSMFNKKQQEFIGKGTKETEWAFHGTSEESIEAICKTGFLHPDDIKKMKEAAAAASGSSSKSKSKSKPKVKAKPKVKTDIVVLDDGFFGRGIYFSFYSDYAMYYSEERGSSQILLSQILVGKAFRCTGRMDGVDLVKGYDSHYSPKGNEVVIFAADQILPRYIIEFEENDQEEREQEY